MMCCVTQYVNTFLPCFHRLFTRMFVSEVVIAQLSFKISSGKQLSTHSSKLISLALLFFGITTKKEYDIILPTDLRGSHQLRANKLKVILELRNEIK